MVEGREGRERGKRAKREDDRERRRMAIEGDLKIYKIKDI